MVFAERFASSFAKWFSHSCLDGKGRTISVLLPLTATIPRVLFSELVILYIAYANCTGLTSGVTGVHRKQDEKIVESLILNIQMFIHSSKLTNYFQTFRKAKI